MSTMDEGFEEKMIRVLATSSTNDYLRTYLAENPDTPNYTGVCAEAQFAGKGQRGNRWVSEAGKNILMSMIYYPENITAENVFTISKAAALATLHALAFCEMEDIRIKWPNDIYWKDRKIAGILIENEWEDGKVKNSIIGVGVNLNQIHFPADLPNPISVKLAVGVEQDREEFLETLWDNLAIYCDLLRWESGMLSVSHSYGKSLYRSQEWHEYEDANGRFKAKIVEVLNNGQLILHTTEGEERAYWFKEVSYII